MQYVISEVKEIPFTDSIYSSFKVYAIGFAPSIIECFSFPINLNLISQRSLVSRLRMNSHNFTTVKPYHLTFSFTKINDLKSQVCLLEDIFVRGNLKSCHLYFINDLKSQICLLEEVFGQG